MKNIFFKIKYFFGTIYRGMIGRYHNVFDKAPKIDSGIENFVIGKSVDGTEIKCFRIKGIGNKGLEKKFLFVGGIHGNEVGTVKMANHIINYFYKDVTPNFSANGGSASGGSSDVSGLKAGVTIYVIPCLNPDGYNLALKNPDYGHRGRIGRFNANGVDLNRNFPTKKFEKYSEWGFGRDYSDEKIKIFCGDFGGSEKETQALMNFIKSENIDNLIMLHNAGKDVVYNSGDEIAKDWAETYHKFAKFKIRTNLNYSGGVSEWARENNIHYLTVEGASRWGSDWKKQKKAVEKIVAELDG